MTVPYSLKVTFVPSCIAIILVTWYFVPSVTWTKYSAERYDAIGKLVIETWDVEAVVKCGWKSFTNLTPLCLSVCPYTGDVILTSAKEVRFCAPVPEPGAL